MNSWRNIYKLHDKLINLLVIVLLSVLCIAFDKLTKVNYAALNFHKAQYLFDADQTKFNVYYSGTKKYTLISDRIQFLSESNRLYCWGCKFIEFDEKTHKQVLMFNSNYADYDIDKQLILAKGNVELHTIANQAKDNIDAFTDHATINTANNHIDSDAAIVIKQMVNELSGIGFSIDSNTNIMIINSHVKLKYKKGSKE